MGLEATVVPQVEQLEAVRLLTEVQQHQDKEITVETPMAALTEVQVAVVKQTQVALVEKLEVTKTQQVMLDLAVTARITSLTLL
jgi:hypothetical protein